MGTVLVPLLGIVHFFWRYRTRYGKQLAPEKVSEPVSVKFGIGKKSRNRYRKNLVPEKSTGIGIVNIWYRKKVSVPVSFKI